MFSRTEMHLFLLGKMLEISCALQLAVRWCTPANICDYVRFFYLTPCCTTCSSGCVYHGPFAMMLNILCTRQFACWFHIRFQSVMMTLIIFHYTALHARQWSWQISSLSATTPKIFAVSSDWSISTTDQMSTTAVKCPRTFEYDTQSMIL